MAKKFKLPEGKIVRTIEGGPGSLKKLLLDLKKYSFDGYVSTSMEQTDATTEGYVVIKAGKPHTFLHISKDDQTRGEESLKKIWADSYRKGCVIKLHAKVEVEALTNLIEKGEEKRDPRFQELEEKMEAWKSDGYLVTELETSLMGDIERAEESFADYEERITRLEEIKEKLKSLETEKFKLDIEEIESRLNDPASLREIEGDIVILEDRISMEKEKPTEEAAEAEAEPEPEVEIEEETEVAEKDVDTKADEVYEMILRHRSKTGELDAEMPSDEEMERDERTNLIPHFVFDSFVVGPSNRFAYAACLAVARTPYKAYNPLFVTSGPGLGKTHLISAIGNFIVEKNPKGNVLYLTTESFSNAYKQAVKDGTLNEFRKLYRNVDVFLLDDAQFLEGRMDVQEELFQ
ncbi:MAG: ATP-binding protein [Methanobacteriota archaeon]|nr:MAG: ATP-binding protein [Euryarchaeota archaeon]